MQNSYVLNFRTSEYIKMLFSQLITSTLYLIRYEYTKNWVSNLFKMLGTNTTMEKDKQTYRGKTDSMHNGIPAYSLYSH